MISLDQADFARLESKVKELLDAKLKGLKLESMSVVDGKVNLQYQYKQAVLLRLDRRSPTN